MRLALLSAGSALVATLLFFAVMRRDLPPEWGVLPVLPFAYAAAALGLASLKKEKERAANALAAAGAVVGAAAALVATAFVVFL